MKDIDLGMMAGAGIIPPPFARADQIGLDDVLAQLEQRGNRVGRGLRARRRSCAASSPRAGSGSRRGQGFFPYARPDAGWDESPVKLETRATDRDRLARPAAGELDLARGRGGAPAGLGRGQRVRRRSARWCSPRPTRCCSAPAPTSRRSRRMDPAARGTELLDQMHGAAARRWRRSSIATIAAVNATRRSAAGASWRWRATSGSRPSRRRSASPRSTSGSFPASAARSGCRGWSARPRRSS